MPARAAIQKQPLGVVGIISPWNYPVYLALDPLVGALAAGNRALIKPSELTPQTSDLLKQLIGEVFEPEQVSVVTGGPEIGIAFSKLAFDHLVFTGSTSVGKLVMRAAAENLVPVTLELGGKSPAIVSDNFSLKSAAEKIIHGKLLNAGQTCIAPDYALVPKGRLDAFVEELKAQVAAQYPRLESNPDYTSIATQRHYDRLLGLITDAKEKGATIVEANPAGESLSSTSRKIAPTFVVGATSDMTVMQDEIFGPILPVIGYGTLDEAIDFVNERPRPLALYYFDHDDRRVQRVLDRTVSGGVTINDTLLHAGQEDLPFGGVGPSGIGHYHGVEGFETFTKKKPIFYQSRISGAGMLNAPYKKSLETMLRFLIGR
jgi:coniferyl-aldehyde dehydrogenase